MSPASTRPLPSASTTCRPTCSSVDRRTGRRWWSLVRVGRRSPSAPVGGVPDGGRGVVDRAGVHVGLGHRVASPCRSSTRPGASVVAGQVTGARPAGRTRRPPVSVTLPVLVTTNDVGDRVAGVDAAVAVDVDRGRRRLVQGDRGRRPAIVRRRRCRSSVTAAPVGGVPRRGRGVVDRPGVDVGLGERVASPCRWSTRPAPASWPGRSTAPTFGSSTRRPRSASRCRCWSPRTCRRWCRRRRRGRCRRRRSAAPPVLSRRERRGRSASWS